MTRRLAESLTPQDPGAVLLDMNRIYRFGGLLAVACLFTLIGCGPQDETAPAEDGQTAKTDPPSVAGFYANLLPQDAAGYVRITDVQKVKNELVQPQHVKDAARVQQQITQLINRGIQQLAKPGNELGVSGWTLLQFVSSVKTLHVGLAGANADGAPQDFLVVLELSQTGAFEQLRKETAPHVTTRKIDGKEFSVINARGALGQAFFLLDAKTVVFGPAHALQAALKRMNGNGGKTLADSSKFRQAAADLAGKGQLFVYVDLDAVRKAASKPAPFETVSHVAGSLGLDGGLTVRAYAEEGKEFPEFLVRTPRERRFLSRIPADAVFLIGQGVDGGPGARKNFVEWVLEELGRKERGRSIVFEKWKQLTASYAGDPARIEDDALAIVGDLWTAVLPVKSESALFVAPDSSRRWGAAYLFDIQDKDRVKALTQQVFSTGNRAKLPWKSTVHEGMTIHYLDFAEIAARTGKPVSPDVAKNVQLQVGYAEGKDLFYLGTLEAMKFAHKPTAATLDSELRFDNVDQKNAIMITIRPGRFLHRTFGVAKIDDVLSRFASQIPRDSSYSVTLNFQPSQLTFRSSIPFVSLGAWIGVEMAGQGPAGLRDVMPGRVPKKD